MRRPRQDVDPAERQADELGKRIGTDLAGVGSVGHGPLPTSVQQVAESHLGVGLAGTQIDASSSGQRKADDESALAVTEGKHIAFNSGELDTATTEGRALLGHELVHVGQQTRSQAKAPQRKFSDEAKHEWNARGGDAVVKDARTLADDWIKYARAPATDSAMPKGAAALRKLEQLVTDDLDNPMPEVVAQLKTRAAERLGTRAIKALGELISIGALGQFGKLLPGMEAKDPKHRYVLTTKTSAPPVSRIRIVYTNLFNWKWSREFEGPFFSYERFPPRITGYQLEVRGRAIATRVPAGYWGYNDFSGKFAVTEGATIVTPGRITYTGMLVVAFGGPRDPVEFKNFTAITCPTDDTAPDVEPPKQAAGKTRGFDARVETRELRPVLAPPGLRRASARVTGFALASARLPIEGMDQLNALIEELRESAAVAEQEARAAGETWALHAKFTILGYASRRWRAADSDPKRLKLNQELSYRRADSVKRYLDGRLGGQHTFDARGLGASVLRPQTGSETSRTAPIIAEVGNEELIEQIIADYEEELAEQFPELSATERRRKARVNLGKASDNPDVRAVELQVEWAVPSVTWEREQLEEEPTPDPCTGELPSTEPSPGTEEPGPGSDEQPNA